MDRLTKISSIYLLLCGVTLYFAQGSFARCRRQRTTSLCLGFVRLLVIVSLSALFIYLIQLAIVNGLTLYYLPIYVFGLVALLAVLFHDCAELDDLESR